MGGNTASGQTKRKRSNKEGKRSNAGQLPLARAAGRPSPLRLKPAELVKRASALLVGGYPTAAPARVKNWSNAQRTEPDPSRPGCQGAGRTACMWPAMAAPTAKISTQLSILFLRTACMWPAMAARCSGAIPSSALRFTCRPRVRASVRACAHISVRVRACACVRARVRVCVRVCACACVRACAEREEREREREKERERERE